MRDGAERDLLRVPSRARDREPSEIELEVWDPADPVQAMAHINTQPVTPERWIGKR
jgi:hypothetical protein